MDKNRRIVVGLIGVSSLSLFSLQNIFTRTKVASNKSIIGKYAPLNGKASKIIKGLPYSEIVAESKRIAPLVSGILSSVKEKIANESLSKLELQQYVIEMLDDIDLLPSMAGYNGFPSGIAISIDSEIIHNIPDKTIIPKGALVTVELGASTNAAYASQAWSYLSVPSLDLKEKLICSAKTALVNAINEVKDGVRLGNIGSAIQSTLESDGYSVVREYCGYVMGSDRIQEPQILGYGKRETGPPIKEGQILNIHVLASEGKRYTNLSKNNWGVKTKDGTPSVALSAMVLVTSEGYELLSSIDI